MKNLIITSVFSLLSMISFAQNDLYLKAMEKSVTAFQQAKTAAELQLAANDFERIAKVEKEAWLPAYYHSLCYMFMAARLNDGQNIEKMNNCLDKAQAALDQAQSLDAKNSEIFTLQGYIFQGRIWEDPMTKGAVYTQKSFEALAKAMDLDPNNPRPYLLKGQHTFFMPVFFGGGVDKALPLFQTAQEKFDAFEKVDALTPNWGQKTNQYFLKRAQAK